MLNNTQQKQAAEAALDTERQAHSQGSARWSGEVQDLARRCDEAETIANRLQHSEDVRKRELDEERKLRRAAEKAHADAMQLNQKEVEVARRAVHSAEAQVKVLQTELRALRKHDAEQMEAMEAEVNYEVSQESRLRVEVHMVPCLLSLCGCPVMYVTLDVTPCHAGGQPEAQAGSPGPTGGAAHRPPHHLPDCPGSQPWRPPAGYQRCEGSF